MVDLYIRVERGVVEYEASTCCLHSEKNALALHHATRLSYYNCSEVAVMLSVTYARSCPRRPGRDPS